MSCTGGTQLTKAYGSGRRPAPALITQVSPDGLGREVGLEPGDQILRINGKQLTDLIQYYLEECSDRLCLEVEKSSGEIRQIQVEKDEEQGLGVTFSSAVFDSIKRCRNRCVFCFVDQMPPDLRSTLYIKDDDYRLSFLQGSYITLSNLEAEDWHRIKKERLSPLYISVHSTEPAVREELFGNAKIRDILTPLQKLAAWGIQMHTQAVIVPGVNDGDSLRKTIMDLGRLWPAVRSLAIVPVGLTKYRQKLPELRKFTTEEARWVLDLVHQAQQRFLSDFGSRLVFAADEFYLQAQESFPTPAEYEDLWQLENGVGLWALFKEEFLSALAAGSAKRRQPKGGDFLLLTGTGVAVLWPELIRSFAADYPEVNIEVRPVPNHFFGEMVTVTGLVTGEDIIKELKNKGVKEGQTILIPQVMLRQGETVFLDGTNLQGIREALSSVRNLTIKTVPVNGATLFRIFLGLEG